MANVAPIRLFWFRRDLRLHDNTALYQALSGEAPVLPLFIFDPHILQKLPAANDARVAFIHQCLQTIKDHLQQHQSDIRILHTNPLDAFRQLISELTVEGVYCNDDYEAYAQERDQAVASLLSDHGIPLHRFKDHVLFEKSEVMKDDGKPYTVFTPYSRKWQSHLTDDTLMHHPSESRMERFFKTAPLPMPTLESLGFSKTDIPFPPSAIPEQILEAYAQQRDLPGINGTSKLGLHLRFGTISIRALARKARTLSASFLNELIWRDFYQMITWHFPDVRRGKAFKPAYEAIPWLNDEAAFDRWCTGQTGYPIVDAGMRELNATGFMHNRVRMITASFLCKHLLIDWRWGEAYFAEKLLDYDFASNNGGWQWASGSGCDAAPYFRIFNPDLQTKKFDPAFTYLRKWVPEFESLTYPKPMIEHPVARNRCLAVYKKALYGD
jgi:deoxyribodipyrimidine photo-lyase